MIARNGFEKSLKDDFYYGSFKSNFIWGTTTSAYQVLKLTYISFLSIYFESLNHNLRLKKLGMNFENLFFFCLGRRCMER